MSTQKIESNKYRLIDVLAGSKSELRMKNFVTRHGISYSNGDYFYQLTKTELIQQNKEIIAMSKKDGELYKSEDWRQFLGLPQQGGEAWKPEGRNDVRINPLQHKDYIFFVQSTAHSRTLVPGTQLLVKCGEW